MNLAVIILAAGEGTRMKSKNPKVLHEILGQPMISYVIDAARTLVPEHIVVVVGRGADLVKERLDPDVKVAIQEKQLGTGHAVVQAMGELEGFEGQVVVLCGDTPLLAERTLRRLVAAQDVSGAALSILTAELADTKGYGRIIRRADRVVRIVEERDASEDERQVKEVNSGTYCFGAETLRDTLGRIKPENDQAEYYLTDVVEIVVSGGGKVVAVLAEEPAEALGVNSRVQLAEATSIMQRRINCSHMLSGVTMIDPSTIFISPKVSIGRDTIIYPNCFLEGTSSLGEDCRIGPGTGIYDSRIGDGAVVERAVVKGADVGKGARLGPFCHVRPGTAVGENAKIGGFVEIKESEIGPDAKVPHLSYVGDATIGKGANLGAGTITCNYDGFEKHRTVIDENAFVGSDTMLVAPVRVGKGAVTGAGSTITQDVPDDALAVERTEQEIIPGWASTRRKVKGSE